MKKKKNIIINIFIKSFKMIAFILLINILIKLFLMRPYVIASNSMSPILLTEDKIFVEIISKHFFKPKRGDIIVFVFPDIKNNIIDDNFNNKFNKLNIIHTFKEYFLKLLNVKNLKTKEMEYTKRVIGMPGDVINIKNQKIYINDKKLNEIKYLSKNIETDALGSIKYPYTVPNGYYFVLGDNRENSFDSRYWGPVPEENIIGKVFLVFFPINHFKFI